MASHGNPPPLPALLIPLGAAREGEAGSKQGGHRDHTVHTWIVCEKDRGCIGSHIQGEEDACYSKSDHLHRTLN